ncbi:hypothetical protein ACFWZY_17140 [Streptomyces sp. NPDC058992]|uniref:hypothetical protein n=1 Tax=Streptomyces sp. NPDC058992 TaxID=3346688 RepID=UPI0036C8B933
MAGNTRDGRRSSFTSPTSVPPVSIEQGAVCVPRPFEPCHVYEAHAHLTLPSFGTLEHGCLTHTDKVYVGSGVLASHHGCNEFGGDISSRVHFNDAGSDRRRITVEAAHGHDGCVALVEDVNVLPLHFEPDAASLPLTPVLRCGQQCLAFQPEVRGLLAIKSLCSAIWSRWLFRVQIAAAAAPAAKIAPSQVGASPKSIPAMAAA